MSFRYICRPPSPRTIAATLSYTINLRPYKRSRARMMIEASAAIDTLPAGPETACPTENNASMRPRDGSPVAPALHAGFLT
jgi:hypothetical protein